MRLLAVGSCVTLEHTWVGEIMRPAAMRIPTLLLTAVTDGRVVLRLR